MGWIELLKNVMEALRLYIPSAKWTRWIFYVIPAKTDYLNNNNKLMLNLMNPAELEIEVIVWK